MNRISWPACPEVRLSSSLEGVDGLYFAAAISASTAAANPSGSGTPATG
jgi:hypothetical protein